MNAAWYIVGAAAVGGLGFYLYEKNKEASSSTAASNVPAGTPAAAADACSKANTLASLASSHPTNAIATFKGAYDSWAARCRAAGGTCNPFPTNVT